MPSVTPFLWFNDNAEAAVAFYASVFPDVAVTSRMQAGGKVMSVTFTVCGQTLIALNGGPHFTFTEAISLFVSCQDQAEVDRYWDALTADGGSPSRCGWLKDKFGLSWQVVPVQLGQLLGDADPVRAQRVMAAMMTMSKLDVAALQAARQG